MCLLSPESVEESEFIKADLEHALLCSAPRCSQPFPAAQVSGDDYQAGQLGLQERLAVSNFLCYVTKPSL